jgi:S1-C subfamily serine protease
MKHKLSMLKLFALLVLSATTTLAADEKPQKDTTEELAAARQRLDQAARDVAELSGKMGRDGMPDNLIFLGRNPNRAMLGIGFERNKDADGVSVLSVSPGGPAAKAGVQPGDVITEINGTPLKQDDKGAAHDKLLDAVAKLSPGDDVSLSYRRGDKSSAAKFKAERLSPPGFPAARTYRFRDERGSGEWERESRDYARYLLGARGGAFDDLELTTLTPELGRYFGTEKGLLIVRAPKNDAIKLEDGDVLLDIDGRVPTNQRHAFGILGSYQAGEKVTLNVLRQKKKVAVSVTVPEERRMRRMSIEKAPAERHRIGPPIPPEA